VGSEFGPRDLQEEIEMQAVDQHKGIGASEAIIRVLAVFGAIVAIVMIVAALAYGAGLVANAVGPKAAITTTTLDTSPAVLAFRAGERESLAQSPVSLYNQFRQGERGDGTQTAQELQNQFRAGERNDNTPTAQQLQNQFRAGERGDSTQP